VTKECDAANALLDAVRNEIGRHDEGDGDGCFPDTAQTIGRIRSSLLLAGNAKT
jgi:hypothetical protein